MSNASERDLERAIMTSIARLGNEITTYTGSSGAVTTVGYIERVQDYLDGEVRAGESVHVVSMLVEDVGNGVRGDRVTDEDGQVWTLVEQSANDGFTTDWTVEKL